MNETEAGIEEGMSDDDDYPFSFLGAIGLLALMSVSCLVCSGAVGVGIRLIRWIGGF